MAIVVAFLAALLLGIASLGVDLGHAYVERQDVQKLSDFAALSAAGGNNLPGVPAGACAYGQRASASDQAVKDAAAYLGSEPWTGGPSAAELVDCDLANGEAVYGRLTYPAGNPILSFDETKLTIVSPPRRVDFGMAGILGFDGTDVAGRATAAIGTPGADKIFPAFATDGCDWGQRTIFAPAAASPGPTFTPVLAFPTDKNITTFDLAIENPSPDSVPVNAPATVVTIRGTNLDTVTQIGFFQEDTGSYQTIAKPAFDTQSATAITITLPDDLPGLTGTAGLWWVRVYAPKNSPTDTTMQWSQVKSGTTLKTIPFEVGESFLRCADVASGSYGDILMPRGDTTSADWTSMNIARGLYAGPPKLSLHTYPGSPTTTYGASSAPNKCLTSDTRTIYSSVVGTPDIKEHTNCIDNGTGLTENNATDGLVAGVKVGLVTYKGRLDTGVDSTCATRRSVTVNGPSGPHAYLINNDVLTCFLKPSVTVSTVASKSYPGGPVISCAIFDSPRFFYQPVLQVRPSGGSDHYSIVDFRPAFISEQAPTAVKGDGSIGENGVTITSGHVNRLDVVFFHPQALPTDCPNSFGPYLGGTTERVLRLTN